MTFNSHMTDLNGLKVFTHDQLDAITDPASSAVRISTDYDTSDDFKGYLSNVLNHECANELAGLLFGCWSCESGDNQVEIEQLVAGRSSLPALRHLFIGDIIYEETEASWIVQTDLSALFNAFDKLESFGCRGTGGLSLGRPQHSQLKKLTVQGGGLPGAVVREIASADLPQLECLEMWLGTDEYGRDATREDVELILKGNQFPKLKSLGLMNDDNADTTVQWLIDSPLLPRLGTIDLSYGTLSDDGANVLLTADLSHLEKLVITYHFISEEMANRVASEIDCQVEISDPQTADVYDDKVYRYPLVGE